MSQVISIEKSDTENALPSLQIVFQWLAGIRLPRNMPFRSPSPKATVCVPSGSEKSVLAKAVSFIFEQAPANRKSTG